MSFAEAACRFACDGTWPDEKYAKLADDTFWHGSNDTIKRRCLPYCDVIELHNPHICKGHDVSDKNTKPGKVKYLL